MEKNKSGGRDMCGDKEIKEMMKMMDDGFYGHMKVSIPKMKAIKTKKQMQKMMK